jgi:hypothetical protein
MKMRLWRMPHGRYQVAVGVDRDGDDKPDEQLRRQEIELCRYDGAVEFAARPKQTLVIELTLLQQLDDVRTRPDLAIGPDDVAVSDGAATVTVHNIGGSASPPGSVQVRAADDKVLGVAQAPALPPPHDLQPVMAQVRIPLRGSEKPARVLLDPDNQIAEVTEANNQAHVRAR